MKQLRYLMILMTAGALILLSYVLFNYGLDKKESLVPLSLLIVLAIQLVFLVKLGKSGRSPNADTGELLSAR
jgi:hypothetical protein